MNIDWSKWGAPAFVLALAGIAVIWARPAIIALIHYLVRYDEAKARETLLIILKSEDGKLKIRAYMDTLYADRWQQVQASYETALANRDSLTQATESIKLQGAELRSINEKLSQLPRVDEALERISLSMQAFAEQMETVSTYVIRAEEREKVRHQYERGERQDRRRRQDPEPHPHDRQGDPNV